MMKIKFLILGILIVSFFNFSCHKSAPDCTVKQTMIPQEILDYMDFKTGTYWIYKDSASGRIDSLVVVSSKHVMEDNVTNGDCGVRVYHQYENVEIVVEQYDNVGKKTWTGLLTFDNGFNMTHKPADYFWITAGVFDLAYPFDKTWYFNPYTGNETFIDSIVVNGLVYKDVLMVYEYADFAPANYFIEYFSKRIGRIRTKNVLDGHPPEHYNLIRYKLM